MPTTNNNGLAWYGVTTSPQILRRNMQRRQALVLNCVCEFIERNGRYRPVFFLVESRVAKVNWVKRWQWHGTPNMPFPADSSTGVSGVER